MLKKVGFRKNFFVLAGPGERDKLSVLGSLVSGDWLVCKSLGELLRDGPGERLSEPILRKLIFLKVKNLTYLI